jgi:hypothetical protein
MSPHGGRNVRHETAGALRCTPRRCALRARPLGRMPPRSAPPSSAAGPPRHVGSGPWVGRARAPSLAVKRRVLYRRASAGCGHAGPRACSRPRGGVARDPERCAGAARARWVDVGERTLAPGPGRPQRGAGNPVLRRRRSGRPRQGANSPSQQGRRRRPGGPVWSHPLVPAVESSPARGRGARVAAMGAARGRSRPGRTGRDLGWLRTDLNCRPDDYESSALTN